MLAPAKYTRLPAVEEKAIGWDPRINESKGYTNSCVPIGGCDEVPATVSLVKKTFLGSSKAAHITLLSTHPGSSLAVANVNPCSYRKYSIWIRWRTPALQAIAPVAVGMRSHIRPRGSATRRLRDAQDGREARLSNSVINQ